MPRLAIAVIGAGTCGPTVAQQAREVGALLALHGVVLVTGGRGGVMEAASRGARDAGGLVIGILPGRDPADANDAVEVAIPTGLGELRNGLVVSSAGAVIALEGEWGTLAEIALARKMGIPVISLGEPPLPPTEGWRDGIIRAGTPREAVDLALQHAR